MAMFALAIGNFLTLSRACQQERNMDGWVTKSEGYSRGEGEVLRVEDLTVQYGALVALSDVSWSVHAGEILGIIGPNGAGKSSCFAAVPNEVTHSGRTFLDDNDVSQTRTFDLASHGLRRTFQHNSFFGELTVLQNAVAALVRHFSASLAVSIFLPWRESASLSGHAGRFAVSGILWHRATVSRQAPRRNSLWRTAPAIRCVGLWHRREGIAARRAGGGFRR